LADAVIHLAGENRPASPDAFEQVNAGLTRQICDGL
jgi:UDP-2-acetamido-2,6-beta-L-arabino-hexul-4-ose reductase